MKNFILFTCVFLLICDLSNAGLLRVPSQFQSIQMAINAASDRDTVLVAPGRYFENIDYRSKSVVVASNFIVSKNWNDVNSTIIDGSRPAVADSASCVRITSSQSRINDTIAALIGFTVTGGTGTVWEDEHNPQTYYREGGGILIQAMAPRIMFNIIKFNEAYNKTGLASAGGGAIRCGDGNPLISNNIIYRNKGRYGAGIVLNFSAARICNNIINSNWGGEDYGGSGIWIYGNNPGITLIDNNTVVKNVVNTKQGGGLYFVSASATVKNNIFWGNTAKTGSQIYVSSAQGTISYCDVQGGYSGTGNIDSDPRFADSSFTLMDGSPCIDAGDTALNFRDIADPANPMNALMPSKGTIRNDIGAFGGKRAYPPTTVITGVQNDGRLQKNGFELFRNYPNPFNPSTKITFNLPKSGHVKLRVYDSLGREVVKLLDNYEQAGLHSSEFVPGCLASSFYYCELDMEGSTSAIKMLYLK